MGKRVADHAQAYEIRKTMRINRGAARKSGSVLKTASHIFMAGVMLMYFVGVALGVYATVALGEPVATTLDYIMRLALVVGLGYFIKAFGENIAKIALPFISAPKHSDTGNKEWGDQGHG